MASPRGSSPNSLKGYTFGVEVESVVMPYSGNAAYTQVDWYRQLSQVLSSRGLPATYDDLQQYRKHPEFYSAKWFVTRDGSLKPLKRDSPLVCMEVVSPKLTTAQPVTKILSEFWEAMKADFDIQIDSSCGGHVHVTPLRESARFTLLELKRVAFAVAVYEEHVRAILPPSRRDNKWCRPNSQSAGVHGKGRGLVLALGKGRGDLELRTVAAEIEALVSETELCEYMQRSRYVLWNFQNTFPDPRSGNYSGTVEFRGASQFRNSQGTLSWVGFALGFITLAEEENLFDNLNFPVCSPPAEVDIESWWLRIRDAARKSKLNRHLPEDYRMMRKK
ncbi:putative amidoligase enzyme-domain-containing protein [Lasiosphaeris hirsuta]|uniref:Amidoligase enzyme-domain-containing protein n=1 Tax=Lasiosphaeris hirsuta TaxID=260670 RepID=A0AA39ZVW4_9PEZI|nr:putative amidoligase enzyme-domain-containing protein [Lasiosphaeris hirsuta]